MVSSEFISKIEFACKKKESLYSQSKFKYAIRSMFAGAFLTFSTAAGAVGADLINKIAPGSGRFLFPFVFAWGLAYIVFLNADLVQPYRSLDSRLGLCSLSSLCKSNT